MKTTRPERESDSDGIGLSKVGAWLKVSREEHGLSLDEVAKVTRIGKNYLEAIEEGALAKLPSQAYTRGFIRLYALHLGLSPENALAMLEVSQTEPAEVKHDTPPRSLNIYPPLNAYRSRLTLIAIVAAVLIGGYLLVKPALKERTPPLSDRAETPYSNQAVTTPASQNQQSQPKNDPSPPPAPQLKTGENQGLVLRLKAVSDGKIHITIDGSVSQDYDLVTGDIV